MKAQEIDQNIQAMLNQSSTIKGHFNKNHFDIGNNQIGYDIFTFSVNRKKQTVYIEMVL